MVNTNTRDSKGRFLKGHKGVHGIYSKKMPLAIRRESEVYRQNIISDLGGMENISTAKMILIEKAMNLYSITLAIELYINANGAFKGKKLEPVLAENYISYVNSLRLCLDKIGLDRVDPQPKSIVEIIKAIDAEKEEDKVDAQTTQEEAQAVQDK